MMIYQRVRAGAVAGVLIGTVMAGMAAPGQPMPPSRARHVGLPGSQARSRPTPRRRDMR